MKMHVILYLLLGVFLSPLFFRGCCGQESEGCSYWYEVQPFPQECAHGATSILVCIAYAPEEPRVDVRWHLTELEGDDLNNGTQIYDSDVYTLQNPVFRSHNNTDQRFADLFRGESLLTISDITENQTGYYWCQMVITESISLEPSEPASLMIGAQLQNGSCTFTQLGMIRPKCVAGPGLLIVPTTTTMPVIQVSGSTKDLGIPMVPTATTREIQISTAVDEASSTPSPTSATGGCKAGGLSCSVYAGIGVAVFIIVLCSLVIFTVVFCRKRSKKQHSRESIETVSTKGPKAQAYGDIEHVVINDLYEPHSESKAANEGSESNTRQQQSEVASHEYDAIKLKYSFGFDSKPMGNTYERLPNRRASNHQDKEAVLSQARPSSLEYEYVTPEQARRYTHASQGTVESNPTDQSTQERLYDMIGDSKPVGKDHGNSPNSNDTDDFTKKGHEYDRPDDAVSSKKGNGKKETHEYEPIPNQQPLNSDTAQHKQEHFYHTLGGPTSESNSGDSAQYNGQKPTPNGKSCEHKYDEPVLYSDTKEYDRSSDVNNHEKDETNAPSSPLFDDLIYQTTDHDQTLPQSSGAQLHLGESKGGSTLQGEVDTSAQSLVLNRLCNKAQSERNDEQLQALGVSPVPADADMQLQPKIISLQLGADDIDDDGMLFDDPVYQV